MGSISYTNTCIADPVPTMVLGKDSNRTELDIYNISINEFIYVGLGDEYKSPKITEMIPLAPGEAYGSSVPPTTAIYLATKELRVPVVVSYSSTSPAYVRGKLNE